MIGALDLFNITDVFFEKKYKQGGNIELLAPNGKPSNLTPEQYKLVRTPEFKAWFGDWENDPKNASKVVDENGEPMVVYRTTKKEDYHNDFLKNKYVFGIYFSEDKNSTNIYGKFTKEYFLNIKNPKLLRGIKYDEMWVYSIITKDKYKNLKDNNNDGAIWKRQNVFYELVVFEPNQIKLADGTNTTFDFNNLDIRYYDGGEVKIKTEILSDRKEDTYTISSSYAEVVKYPKDWFIEYIESCKKGDGTKLMDRIIKDAKEQNIYSIRLQTGNGSESYFEKFGFRIIDNDNGYIYMEWHNFNN